MTGIDESADGSESSSAAGQADPPGIMLTVQEIQEQTIPVRVIQTVEMVLMTTVLMMTAPMMTAPMMIVLMMKGIMMRVLMMIPDINRSGLRIST